MTKFFEMISAKCKALSAKHEIELIDEKINSLAEKKAKLTGKADVRKETSANVKSKSKAQATCSKDDLIINVAANVQVKDICRNIERKLQRNLSSKSESDKQMLYNHLFYFYSIKHVNTLPTIHGKNKDYHINDYVSQRTNSVINDITCHINFGK
jgi:hypothetical protein